MIQLFRCFVLNCWKKREMPFAVHFFPSESTHLWILNNNCDQIQIHFVHHVILFIYAWDDGNHQMEKLCITFKIFSYRNFTYFFLPLVFFLLFFRAHSVRIWHAYAQFCSRTFYPKKKNNNNIRNLYIDFDNTGENLRLITIGEKK